MHSRLTVLPSLFLILAATAIVQIGAPLKIRPDKPTVRKALPVATTAAAAAHAPNARIIEAYGRLPLSFEANRGQAASAVKFLSRGGGYSLFLTATEAVMELREQNAQADSPQRSPRTQRNENSVISVSSVVNSREAAVLRMKLVGANASARIEGADELPGKSNFFIGNDPSKWRTNVPTYAKVRYENVYSGIDLVYYGNQRQLEYDFVVAPGADPRAIHLAFPVSNPSRDSNGAPPLRIDGQGNLVLDSDGNELRLHRPVIYQEISGSRQRVGGNFVIQSGRQVGFEVARYDASKPLIIDPVLSYSTYLGGSGDDYASGIAVDSSGSAYVTGTTASTNFPTANAFQAALGGGNDDAFVTKLNAAGSALVYSTYLGGSGGDGGSGIAVDSSGNAYVTGSTTSSNFPVTANAFQANYARLVDAFVVKLNPAGSALVYSTYLGGYTFTNGSGIAVDSSGSAYVTGSTQSAGFPTANAFQAAFGGGFYDAFVTKLTAAGSALVYYTLLGGNSDDISYGIAVDSSGNAYVTGSTTSSNFPTANAFQAANGGVLNAFVTKLNAAGSALVYSTYLGGSGGDYGRGIALDSSGNAYVTGQTRSTNFPTANAFQAAFVGGNCGTAPFTSPCSDAFVTKFNAAGSALVYSTYLGGSSEDSGLGIAVDSSGNAYVTGFTWYNFPSANALYNDFPTANAFQAAFGGGYDAFVTKLNAAGSALVYSTFLGGSGGDIGNGIAVDSSGGAYVTGITNSTNFPTANAFQAGFGGGNPSNGGGSNSDAFVTKFPAVAEVPQPPPPSPPVITSLSPSTAIAGGTAFTLAVSGSNFSAGAIVLWNGSSRATTFVSASQLNAAIQASDIAAAGTAQITVVNSPLGGGTSAAFSFTITAPATNPVPVINSLSNAVPINGATGFVLTVNGSNFVSASVVQWNGSSRVTTYVSGIQLTAILTAADISAGSGQVTVVNPSPGGGVSNAVTYTPSSTGSNSIPVLVSLSPATAVAAGAAFTLTVSGSNFAAASVVLWNGNNRATTFVSSSQLTAAITAADIAAVGTAQVTVFNPGAGGGISNALTFFIGTTPPGSPTPTVNAAGTVNGASFAQQALAAGSIASVFGTGFAISNASASNVPLPTTLGGVTVRLNGIAAPLFAVTPQQINFQIPWELAGLTQASLTVTTSGGTTAPVTVALANLGPGLFSINSAGSGQGAILIANSAAMAAPVGTLSGSRPALRGETISIYATGLGPVTPPLASGAATPNSPASTTTTPPTASIGGVAATVTFAGLAPGFAGLYQVNVQVPQSVTPGNAVPVALSYSGPGGIGTAVISNTVTIAVQ